MVKKRKKHSGGRPLGEVGKLARRAGITRQAAWYRLNRATGKPVGRPRGSTKERKRQAARRKWQREMIAAIEAMG